MRFRARGPQKPLLALLALRERTLPAAGGTPLFFFVFFFAGRTAGGGGMGTASAGAGTTGGGGAGAATAAGAGAAGAGMRVMLKSIVSTNRSCHGGCCSG